MKAVKIVGGSYLTLTKEEKSMSQIALEYGVHVNQLRQWRDKSPRKLAPRV
ncbi:hypothetical protein CULT_2320006 [[Clostridium] ultunense Esp]|nr:hypothetical protein CULT_2320006 [[Clostridium] ultunense Esp]